MDELRGAADAAIPEGYESVDEFLTEARKRFQEGVDADRENRDAALDDLKFLTGEGQWEPTIRAARQSKGRPCLVINTLPQFIGQVIGDTRQNSPAIKVRPAEDGDKQIANARQGLIRFIENQSRAQQVYALAGEDQVACGIGHFRVGLEYATDDSFDQDIRLKHIPNPFAVVWDAFSVEPTGADARFCFVTDQMDKASFEAAYPDSQTTALTVPQSERANGWVSQESVRVTEYWIVKETVRTIALMKKGGVPKITDITDREDDAKDYIVTGPDGQPKQRQVVKRSACMYLTNGYEILAGPYEYPISRLPIFKVTGREVRVAEKRYRFGLIRFAKDAVRMKNLWRSSAAEWLAQAPKQQWLLHAADEKEANRYRNAGKSGDTVLIWSGTNPPQRMDPPTAPNALLQEAALNDQDIKDVTGLQDASLGIKSNETSGKAINARERAGDVATFMYHDNLNAAIQAGGSVINELLPVVYDTARTITIIGEDETTSSQRINDPQHPESLDLGNGKYDVVVETGPSYSTKRVEAAESMMQFVQAVPAAGQAAADLIAAAQDWPGADAIAERLRKMLPPNLADDPKDMTPEQQQQREQAMQEHAQQMQTQQQAQQLGMAEQDAKVRKLHAEAMKIEAEARAAGQPQGEDPGMTAAALRKAQAEADEAEANAGIAYFNLQQLVANPHKAEAEASLAEAKAAREHIGAASDMITLHRQPQNDAADLQSKADAQAHSQADLDLKLNPPPEEAGDASEPAEA